MAGLRLGLGGTATHLVSHGLFRHGRSMALDLYQRLGLKRGASEAEIKKAYRSLAKQLHPDRNQDNPNAAKRFAEVTHAYDLLSDKDKRAQYDRGELDEEGNPKMPFGGGFGGYSAGAGGPQPMPVTSATCSKGCSAAAQPARAARAADRSAVSGSARECRRKALMLPTASRFRSRTRLP
jgi:curved DNA-binding protein CbpA